MKTFYYIQIISVTFLYMLTGCNSFLDRAPLSDLSPDTYFSNSEDMKAWTAGIYTSLQITLKGGHIDWGDIRTDNNHTTGYEDERVYMNSLVSTQGEYSWENLYKTIDRCNVAIEKFPTIPDITEGEYSDYLGQAYGIRALMYFYAIRVWGDVPLIIETWDGDRDAAMIPRTPVNDIKMQIESDIDAAISMLSTSVTASRKYYFNLGTGYALKTDFHMWFHEYPQALEASEFFINHSHYSLVESGDDWKNMFINPTTSTETISNVFWSYEDSGTSNWIQRYGASNTNNPWRISQSVFNLFIDRLYSDQGIDERFPNTMDTVRIYYAGDNVAVSYNHWNLSNQPGLNKCIKYSERSSAANTAWEILSTTSGEVEFALYRLADVLLLRAEALNQTGRPTEALEIVNQIRNRVGYLADAKTEVNINDKAAVEWVILTERQLEFLCEGKRYFDLRRTNRLIEVMDPIYRARQEASGVQVIGFGHEGRILFPIYYREFQANPSLVQNEPYSMG